MGKSKEIWGRKSRFKKWGWGRISGCRELHTPLAADVAEQPALEHQDPLPGAVDIAEKGSLDLLSLIYLTTESGSSVVERWARCPEVAGLDPRSDSTIRELSN